MKKLPLPRARLLLSCLLLSVFSVLAACGNNGESAPPPNNVRANVGDAIVEVTWDVEPGVVYWLFYGFDAGLTTANWNQFRGANVLLSVSPPVVFCDTVANGRTLYLTVNGRKDGGPGGEGSPTIGATPRRAGTSWTLGTATGSNLNAIAYGPTAACRSSGPPTGNFAAVGPGAAIFMSSDRSTWTARTAPAGYSADLFGVAAVNSNLDDPANPSLRYVAVGAGSSSIYSTDTDATTWATGVAFDAAAPTLRALAAAGTTFVAVGDGGAVLTSSDGIAWTARTSNTTADLTSVFCVGNSCWAAGAGGVVITTTDLNGAWTLRSVDGAPSLAGIVRGNKNNSIDNNNQPFINTVVAVGAGGAAAYSTDQGATWTALTIAGAADLVGVSYTTHFVAVDTAGNAFTSVDGKTWSAAIATGLAAARAITTTGYGFVAVGAGGVNASSF